VSPLFNKLVRDARRHRAQFIAVGLTVFLGVTLFAASYDSFQNLTNSYDATSREFKFANLTVAGGDVEAFADEARATEGVESVQVRTVLDVPLQVGETKLSGRIVGLPATGQPTVNKVKILAGTYLDQGAMSVLVEQHMAEHFGLTPGDSISILGSDGWVEVSVGGVAASPEYIWPARSRQEVITTPDNFGVVFGGESFVQELGRGPNEVAVYFAEGQPDTRIESQLEETAYVGGAVSVQTREEQPSNAALEEDLAGFEEMALFFPILFLAASALAAYVTINRLVTSQRPYIGVLAANGFTRGQILRHYLGYGLLPGLVGSIPGAVAGVLLARVITNLYTDLLAVPITIIDFYPTTLAIAVAFGVASSLAAALAPALMASRVAPAAAMRGETPARVGRPSLLERAVPLLARLPVRWRMALRGVTRNRKRTVYTVIGVVLSLMLVLVSWGMIDTIQYLLDQQYVTIQREDATVQFLQPVSRDRVGSLTEVDGVSRAEPTLQVPISLNGRDGHYDTILNVLAIDTEMHAFMDPDGGRMSLPAEGVLVGKATRDLIGVEQGSRVEMTIPSLGATIEETITGFLDEPLGTMAYMSWDRAASLAGGSLPASSALIRYEDGANPDEIRQAMMARPEVAAFEDTNAVYDTMQDLMVLFYAFVGVMLVFGGAMAFALIFSSMSVNIAERSREMATLLAVGADKRSLTKMITTENMLIVAPAIPIGLVAGYFLSKAALATFSSDLFTFDLYMRPSTFVYAGLAIVAVALLSQIPGLRAIRRIDIPKVVKERAA
jgi:putative ABC transport system permease protein